jgi:hypothetical protein
MAIFYSVENGAGSGEDAKPLFIDLPACEA